MARPTTSAKASKWHMTKKEKETRLAIENRLQGGKFVPIVPDNFTEAEAEAYMWLCEVLKPADFLGEPDRETVELAAVTIARINQLDDMVREDPSLLINRDFNIIRNSYIMQYGNFCKELCLSPGARSKIGALAANTKKADDPLLKVLSA